MILAIIVVVLFMVLTAFAIHKKDSVKASFRIPWFGFSLEAKNSDPEAKRDKTG